MRSPGHHAVGKRHRTLIRQIQRGVVGTDDPDLTRDHAPGEHIADGKSLYGFSVCELVEARLIAQHRGAECLGKSPAITIMMPTRQEHRHGRYRAGCEPFKSHI